jgi:hypothetical protein
MPKGADVSARAKLYTCAPFAAFLNAPSGARYVAGGHGLAADEIIIDEGRAADLNYLLAAGCRVRR